MEFRPCIDIHNGKVKQIVGSSLKEPDNHPTSQTQAVCQGQPGAVVENFVAKQDAAYFARLYKRSGIRGGHVILLNPPGSDYYQETKAQALAALAAYPGGLQVGGGITPENAFQFLEAGASHVIVTSYVFQNGKIHYGNLDQLVQAVGKKRLVLDLSCRRREGRYYIVTDRWQKFTEEEVTTGLLDRLSGYADEFLIHAVDVEGKARGIETGLVRLLGEWGRIPVTYAGGIGSFADLKALQMYGKNKLNVTIGSALDLFGGPMPYQEVIQELERNAHP